MNKDSRAFLVVLGLLGALPPLSIDIVTPTLLTLGRALGTSETGIAAVITFFMVGFGVGQFGAGLLSDTYGRRPVLLVGLTAYALAGIGCALASSLEGMVLFRVVQGAGAGSCSVMTFAIVRDLFQGDAARVKRSYLTVIFGITPMLAPLLGASIASVSGWQGVYAVLACLGAGLLAVVTGWLPESNVEVKSDRPQTFRASYQVIRDDRRFLRVIIINCLSYAAVFSYIAGAPFVFIGDFGLSPSMFGLVFACGAASLSAGAVVSGKAARRGATCQTVVSRALLGSVVTCGLVAGLAVTGWGGASALMAALALALFCRGVAAPNLQHFALEPLQRVAGTAAAIMGIFQIMAGAAASALVAVSVPHAGPGAMGILMLAFAGLAALLWRL